MRNQKNKPIKKYLRLVIITIISIAFLTLIVGLVSANTIDSSKMYFQGTLAPQGDGYIGILRMLDEQTLGIGDNVAGYDLFAREGVNAWFGNDPGSGPVWSSQAIAADHDAWPSWNPDTPDWYQYSLQLSYDGTNFTWSVRNHAGATEIDPWYTNPTAYPARGVPLSGSMNWQQMYATETDVGAYLSGTGIPEIPDGALGYGGGPACWDMDWSWGSEVVPLEYPGFEVTISDAGGGEKLVILQPAPMLEVSQPTQLTTNTYYERGQSIVYDGANYWLFYGRSATVTGSYATANPDINDYELYYKKASTIDGLVSAVADDVDIASVTVGDSYLGETGASYIDSKVWSFVTIDDLAGYTDLFGYYTSDGGTTWTEVGPIVEDMSDGQGHHDEIVFNNELWIVEGSGNFQTIHSATPTNVGSFSTPLQVGTLTGGLCHFFIDDSKLYLALGSGGTYYIYIYNDTAIQWDLVDDKTISGYYDPTLFKVGSDFVFAAAPYTGGRQWIVGWADPHLDDQFFNGAEVAIIDGQYGTNVWVDMWPIGYTDQNEDTYLFFTSERNPSDPTSEINGNIWVIKYDWNPYHDHYTYIQEAIDAATGTTISLAAGSYDETINIDTKDNITISGAGTTQTFIQPSTTLPWNVASYGSSRQAGVRVVFSSNITIRDITFNYSLVKANAVHGFLFWDSEGIISNNVFENMSVDDLSGGYYEIMGYLRAPGFSHSDRAEITVANNTFIDTGRIGVCTHQYLDISIENNIFYKIIDDFGYAIEFGSESTGRIIGNTIYGFDIPAASDGSNSAGIYVENSFTWSATPPGLIKDVLIEDNEIYDCQWGLYIGNEFDGYCGDVDIEVTVQDNYIHDNIDGGVVFVDEDKAVGSSLTATCEGNILDNNGDVGYFIYTWGDGDITVSLLHDQILNHDDVGIYLNDYATGPSTSSYDVDVSLCIIDGNVNYGIQNDNPNASIIAENNYWGDSTGPQGSGDGVAGAVDSYPFIDSDPPWTATIELLKNGEAGVWDTVAFGEKIDAADGKDSYDIPKPGLPPNPYINGWFDASLPSPYSRLWEDYRLFPNETKIFELYVQANTQLPYVATTDVDITWNRDQINASEYHYVELYDGTDTFLLNMRTHDSYTLVGAVDDIPYHFKIKCRINQPPIAVDDYISVLEGGTATVLTSLETSVLANDTDAEGNTLTATLIQDVSHGTLILNSDGTFSYVHDGSETISDSFIYQADDGIHHSDNATVHIAITPVNDDPVANDDIATTDEDVLVQIDVLANDVDAEDGIPTLDIITIPATHGLAEINETTNKIDYTPDANWSGIDTFTYQVNDSDAATDTALVTVTVTAVNDPPVVNDDSAIVKENSTNNQIDVLLNDSDVDGDNLRVFGTGIASHGSVTFDDDYVYYTPTSGYNGTDSFTYTVTDDNGSNVVATVEVEILNLHKVTVQSYWNLISIPFYEAFDKTDIIVVNNSLEYTWAEAISEGIILDIIYKWARLSQSYGFINILEPGQGYWLWSYYDNVDLIFATNTVGSGHITDTNTTWNIIGLPYATYLDKSNIIVTYSSTDYTWAQAVTNNIVLDFIYGWNAATQNYMLASELSTGQGYWMYTYFDEVALKK